MMRHTHRPKNVKRACNTLHGKRPHVALLRFLSCFVLRCGDLVQEQWLICPVYKLDNQEIERDLVGEVAFAGHRRQSENSLKSRQDRKSRRERERLQTGRYTVQPELLYRESREGLLEVIKSVRKTYYSNNNNFKKLHFRLIL